MGPSVCEDVPLRLGREQSDPFLYLCDLLSGFLLQHSYQSHFFVLSSNISAKVATLLYAREKHLRLCETSPFLRFFFCVWVVLMCVGRVRQRRCASSERVCASTITTCSTT